MRLRVKAKIAGRMSELDVFLQENASKVLTKDAIVSMIGEVGFDYLDQQGLLRLIDPKKSKYRVMRKKLTLGEAMKLTVKAEDKRQYFTGEGVMGECRYEIRATKLDGKLSSALIYITSKDGGNFADAELHFDSHYGKSELEPQIYFGSSSDKSIKRALAVYNAIAVAIAIAEKGPSWVEANIKPE